MKIRPLVIDAQVRANIKALVDHAAAHPIDLHDQFRRMRHNDPIGNNPLHSTVIPRGYRCTFSIEDQPIGRCRHLSISVGGGNTGAMPNLAAVQVLMKEFGFRGQVNFALTPPEFIKSQDLHIYTEQLGPFHFAINLLQLLDLPAPSP